MPKRFAVASFVLFVAAAAYAQNPALTVANALDEARASLAKGEFAAAENTLRPMLAIAPSIEDKKMREQALTAIHFYCAVAFAGMNQDNDARYHLREFFRLSPGSNHVDEKKYDQHFVTLFNSMIPAREEDRDTFAMYYPGFRASTAARRDSAPASSWGDSPALEILASPAEKRQWNSLASIDDRTRFIADFWKRRDPTPETPENGFRDMFEQRVAFADRAFGTTEARGAVTDRGKVFVLLGEPAFVRRRPIKREDQVGRNRVWIDSDAIINGTVEQWVYTRDQLPIRLIKPSITFRFVTQEGIGIGIWQKEDAYTQQALVTAGNPNAAR